ncbi:MAG: DUF58 domain-containing protein [Steroidobacteraceae bacterium]
MAEAAATARRAGFLPARPTVLAVLAAAAAAALARALGVEATLVNALAALWLLGLAGVCILDWRQSGQAWRASAVRLQRRLPQALAIGVPLRVTLRLSSQGEQDWQLQVFDHALPPLQVSELPADLHLMAGRCAEFGYGVRAEARGEACWLPAQLRVRSLWGLGWLDLRLGECESRRVLPDFAQISRFAWLADQHRLGAIGVRSRQRRGEGTDFRQLTEYRPGDAIRHIDWKATLRSSRVIVREFQDERDQPVLVLLDCGRRMRSAEQELRGAHFDQVLNAVVLLAYVALRHGDAVGVMTSGMGAGAERHLAPTKGIAALNRLVAGLHDLQPTLNQPDFLVAARELMARQKRRALVVWVSSFRSEDDTEVRAALRLLRSRHLVMFASIRELALRQAVEQPLTDDAAVLEVATAHWYGQQRSAALARLAAQDALLVDAEPQTLGVELVNRYNEAKRAGLI